MPGQPHPPEALTTPTRFVLRGLLQAAGCDVVDLASSPTARRTRAARATPPPRDSRSSGGVSVGEEDHLRPAVQAEGALELWQVAMKPGKPLAFGRVGATLFVGLPGNPVSVFVTFVVAVAPLLRALQGIDAGDPPALALRAEFDWPRPDRRREFVRARITASGGVALFPNQSSAVLTSTVWADGLVDIAAGQTVASGELVRFLSMEALIWR